MDSSIFTFYVPKNHRKDEHAFNHFKVSISSNAYYDSIGLGKKRGQGQTGSFQNLSPLGEGGGGVEPHIANI